MKSYKALLNSLSNDPSLRQLTDDEVTKLRKIFLKTFQDLDECCKKYNLTVMLIGGTVIGAVRHNGFIPWDDDLDVAMPREDFEKLKKIFDQELGDKYILSSPNYKNNANNRFPMMLVKNTLFVEAGNSPEDEVSKIKIDIFIIENVPTNSIYRKIKGLWCSALMAMGSYVDTYEHQNEFFKNYMCKTVEGRKAYNRRIRLGKLFSFNDFQKWMNIIDKACQYKKETSLMGIPSGRGHYFGEIRPRETFLPVSEGLFENIAVNLPGNPDDYISNLYGKDYMTLPPEDKRERHFFVDIAFRKEDYDV